MIYAAFETSVERHSLISKISGGKISVQKHSRVISYSIYIRALILYLRIDTLTSPPHFHNDFFFTINRRIILFIPNDITQFNLDRGKCRKERPAERFGGAPGARVTPVGGINGSINAETMRAGNRKK